MSYPTAVQRVFDEFCRDAGLQKKSGSWYRRDDELITILNLQKSNYSVLYYINLDLWLQEIEPATFPPHYKGHIRSRADRAIDPFLRLDDAEDPGDPEGLRSALDQYLAPSLAATATIADLRSEAGRVFLAQSQITGDAQPIVDRW